MPSKVIVAAAGSGKTEMLIQKTLESEERVLILTYTNENLAVIKERFVSRIGFIPKHVVIQSWFGFLLKEAVRPYQNLLYNGPRVRTLNFEPLPKEHRYIPRSETSRYFFSHAGNIHRDKVSDFAVKCNEQSGGLIVNRLAKMYSRIYIDEIQDLAGYDLDFLELLMCSSVEMLFVGDIRQATYVTNNTTKNKQFKGRAIINWFKLQETKGRCKIEFKTDCHRCNQTICDFADKLYPDLERTVSHNKEETGHDGIFYIKPTDVSAYIQEYSPQILRWDKNVAVAGIKPLNFGQAKGQTFERVLIYPTTTIAHYLKRGSLTRIKNGKTEAAFDISKFYVAVTRARYSVAILMEENPVQAHTLSLW